MVMLALPAKRPHSGRLANLLVFPKTAIVARPQSNDDKGGAGRRSYVCLSRQLTAVVAGVPLPHGQRIHIHTSPWR